MATADARPKGLLDWIEWLGNKLPDPVMLFLGATVIVMALSLVGSIAGWSVQPKRAVVQTQPLVDAEGRPQLDAQGKPLTTPVLDAQGKPVITVVDTGEPIKAKSLLTSDGVYWLLTNMVKNFINFAPLGLVLTGMLGIGVAEKVGFFGATMKWLAGLVPNSLLTPTIVFLGVMSSLASDAGYIVLPPLAAALYAMKGRSPVAGIAAAFAGVAAGFSANLLPSAGDALMAGLTTTAAQIIEPKHTVNPLCNIYFMQVSTILLTLVGWFVTARLIEPRFAKRTADEGGPQEVKAEDLASQRLSPGERRGLLFALLATVVFLAVVLAAVLIPGAPLHGRVDAANPSSAPKWTQAIVPMIFVGFLTPGIAYGMVTGSIRSFVDVAKAFTHAMATMAPVIVLAFFAAQFIECFKYSNLDRMLAFAGGDVLLASGLHPKLLLVALILLVMLINLFIGSMSAKWAMLSPIVVPMLMMVGLSPELVQATYRVGDSATNIVTPLNTYMVIILVVLQRYWKQAGVGSLIATMIPYSFTFFLAWTALLLVWVAVGAPLGVQGPLNYVPHP